MEALPFEQESNCLHHGGQLQTINQFPVAERVEFASTTGTPVYYDCGEGALNRRVVSCLSNPYQPQQMGACVQYNTIPHMHVHTCSEIRLGMIVYNLVNLTGVFKL